MTCSPRRAYSQLSRQSRATSLRTDDGTASGRARNMPWGRAEMAPEVLDWLLGLSDDDFGYVAYHIDLLQELGPRLGEPHVRQLEGSLRVLRFHLGTRPFGLTHCVASMRRFALLTVFRED